MITNEIPLIVYEMVVKCFLFVKLLSGYAFSTIKIGTTEGIEKMVEKRSQDTVSIALIRILLKHLENAGLNSLEICKTAGIDASMLDNNGARVLARQFHSVWKKAVQLTDDNNFGLHFGREIIHNYHGGNFLLNIMMNCPTVRGAIKEFMRYYSLMTDGIRPRMEEENDLVYLSWSFYNRNFRIPRHISEALLSTYVHILGFLMENDLNLVEVRFIHARPGDTSEHERIFKAPLLFEQPDNELIIKKKVLDAPIFSANPELLKTLEQFAQNLLNKIHVSNTWADRVIESLGNLLPRGERTGIETIAGNLSVSVRSLQMKLKDEGTSYQKLLDTVRKEIALKYLEEKNTSICDIAFLLGYSEQSAFNHAFRRWTKSTPGRYYQKRSNAQ